MYFEIVGEIRNIGMKPMTSHLVICTENRGYEASLEPRKLYETLPDRAAGKHGQLRVINESGEDYLYPKSFFVAVKLPQQVAKRVLVRLPRRSTARVRTATRAG